MFKSLSKKWWFKFLFVGVLIRLVLMPITLHPDLWGHSSTAYFFAYEGRLDVYNYFAKLPPDNPLVKSMGVNDIFIYPPLTYFTLGVFRLLVRPFTDPNFMPMIWNNNPAALAIPTLEWHLFLYKLPYLFIDIAAAFLFASLFDEKKKKAAFALWMFNPLTLYATFMIGQIDILPTFFTIFALYMYRKKSYYWSAFALGIGGSYKLYPLLLLIPLVLLSSADFKERLKLFLFGLLPFVAISAPYLGSSTFRQMVLFSPKSQKMLFMGWNVSGSEVVYPFLIILSSIYLYLYYAKTKLSPEYYFLLVLMLIFAVTHYHPQWFLWITPFLFWVFLKFNYKYGLLIISLFLTWFVITLFFESSLTYGLFNPLFPDLRNVMGLTDVISKYTDVFQLKSMVRSYFAGASIFLAYIIPREFKKFSS